MFSKIIKMILKYFYFNLKILKLINLKNIIKNIIKIYKII